MISRDGVDMRPTLLRVLTDLYLQRPTHPPEDERHYTELALRLIDATDIPERAALAARLAPYASAPHAVIERLARDVPRDRSPDPEMLTMPDRLPISRRSPKKAAAYAEIIATREPPPSPLRDPRRLPTRQPSTTRRASWRSCSTRPVRRNAD